MSLPLPAGPFFTLLVKGPELGAQPSVYLAVAEELEGVTGCYYDVMIEKEPAPKALDQEVSRRLWEASARLMGLEQAASAAVPASNRAQEKPSTDPDTKIIAKHSLSALEQTGMNPGV